MCIQSKSNRLTHINCESEMMIMTKTNTKTNTKKVVKKAKTEHRIADVVVSKQVYDYIQSIDFNAPRSKSLRVLQKRQLESFLICQECYSRQEIVEIVTSVFKVDRLTSSTINTDLSDSKSYKYSRLVHFDTCKRHYSTERFDESLCKKVFCFAEKAENS
jgi:hypothetical protein